MGDCCCPPATSPVERRCPTCGAGGTPVNELTVKALLSDQAMNRYEHDAYRFCPDPRCSVVYFSDRGPVFGTSDVRVSVWQKTPPGARTICYCFGEREDCIRSEVHGTGDSAALERVRAHISERRCACEIRNPRGACCLGELMAIVKRIESEVDLERSREDIANR